MKRKHKLVLGLLAVLCCIILCCAVVWTRMALSGPEETLPAEETASIQPSAQDQHQAGQTPVPETAVPPEQEEGLAEPSPSLESAVPAPSPSGTAEEEQPPSSDPTKAPAEESPVAPSAPAVSKQPSVPEKTSDPTEAVTVPNTQIPQQQAPAATYTLSVRCDTLSAKRGSLDPGVAALVPENGVILQEISVEAKEGETAFSLLQRVLREKKIHLEFQKTPGIGSVYVEGIANVYEMDGGPLSGWLYQVNGAFYSASASDYMLSPGDRVVWLYTCDLGRDVGAPSVAR